MIKEQIISTIFKVITLFVYGSLIFWLGIVVGTYNSELKYNGLKYDGWMMGLQEQEKQITDRINESQLLVTNESITIKGDYYITGFTNSDSMLPLLDYGSNGINIEYKIGDELNVGDIISYYLPNDELRIVHRIIHKGVDEEGQYYITKGDNIFKKDPYLVRPNQIKGVMVGILW